MGGFLFDLLLLFINGLKHNLQNINTYYLCMYIMSKIMHTQIKQGQIKKWKQEDS